LTTPDPPPIAAEAVAWVRAVAEPIARRLAGDHLAESAASKGRRTSATGAPNRPQEGSHVPRAKVHVLLDLLLDLADAATRFGIDVAVDLVKVGRAIFMGATSGDSARSAVLSLGQAAAGEAVSGTLDLANTTIELHDAVRLRCGGLVGEGNERIPSSRIDVEPRQLDVQPGATTSVTVTVRVPPRARRGGYTGVLEVVGRPEVYALVSLEVL